MPYPYVRLATEKDLPAIHEIWMLPHVNQYMSFAPMSFEEFESLYEIFKRESEIYVMVEKWVGKKW